MATIMMLGTQRVRLCACCAKAMPTNVARETDVDCGGLCEACGTELVTNSDDDFAARMAGMFYAAFDSVLPCSMTIPAGGQSGLYR